MIVSGFFSFLLFDSHQIKKAQHFRIELLCGLDGTRTRDPLRDRQVF